MPILRPRAYVEEGAAVWTLTFADLTMQVLIFFVLFFSLSSPDIVKLKALAAEFQVLAGGAPLGPPDRSQFIPWVLMEYQDVARPGGAAVKSVQGKDVLVERVHEGLKISLGGVVPFAEGESALLPEAAPVVDEVADLLRGSFNRIEVRGFAAGNREDAEGDRDWDLSFARARACLERLAGRGIQRGRLIAVARGRNEPLVDDLDPALRARNRRVEFVVSEEVWEPSR
ncbi:MAG: OmpA family protein [Planctomycetes bacterium]|nr:OmpA family protein [Planctomycetota bacterium]